MEKVQKNEVTQESSFTQNQKSLDEYFSNDLTCNVQDKEIIPFLLNRRQAIYFRTNGGKVPVTVAFSENLDLLEITIQRKVRVLKIGTVDIMEISTSNFIQVHSEEFNMYPVHVKNRKKVYLLGFKLQHERDQWHFCVNYLLMHSKMCTGPIGIRKYCDNITANHCMQQTISTLQKSHATDCNKLLQYTILLKDLEKKVIQSLVSDLIHKIESENNLEKIRTLQGEVVELRGEKYKQLQTKQKFLHILEQKNYEINMLTESLDCIQERILVLEPDYLAVNRMKIWKNVVYFCSYDELLEIGQVNKALNKAVKNTLNDRKHWNFLINKSLHPREISWKDFLTRFVNRIDEHTKEIVGVQKSKKILKMVKSKPVACKFSELYKLVLAAIGLFPGVDYCEELKKVCEFLVLSFKSSQNSIGLLTKLLGSPYNLAELWKPGLHQLKLTIFQLHSLMKLKLPFLLKHFKQADIVLYDIVTPWILTVFTCFLKKKSYVFTISRIWDIFIVQGWPAILSACLSLLYLSQEKVIGESLEFTFKYFKKPAKCEDIYKTMKAFTVTEEYLAELEQAYYLNDIFIETNKL